MAINSKRKIIAIVGPTASGKTGIGVRLAKEIDGEIVSADSRQVFRGMDIGTGKDGSPCNVISSEQRESRNLSKRSLHGACPEHSRRGRDDNGCGCRCIDNIPQWLIDIKNPGEKFTLFDWLTLAREKIEEIFSRGKTPIIVGGTGLYVQGLIEGFELQENQECSVISSDPGASEEPRNPFIDKGSLHSGRDDKKRSREQLNNLSIEQLREMLLKNDSELYRRVDLKNRHRIIRAIEKAQAGLKPNKIKPDFKVLQIGIDINREELFKKIDDRVEERFQKGMLEEIIYLLASGVKIDWMIKIGLEYRIIGRFVTAHSPFPPKAGNPKSEILNPKQFSNLAIEQLNFPLSPAFCVIPSDEVLESRNLSIEKRSLHGACPEHSRRGRDDKGDDRVDNIKKIANQLRSLPEYEVMKQELKYAIHTFARRQLTWFRRFPEIKWLNNYNEIEKESSLFLEK